MTTGINVNAPLTTVAKNDYGNFDKALFWRHEDVDVEYLPCVLNRDSP